MNKAEAIESMNGGHKVTHPRFLGSDYIELCIKSKHNYKDEQGNVFLDSNFWRWRTGPSWDKDWTIYKQPIKRRKNEKRKF